LQKWKTHHKCIWKLHPIFIFMLFLNYKEWASTQEDHWQNLVFYTILSHYLCNYSSWKLKVDGVEKYIHDDSHSDWIFFGNVHIIRNTIFRIFRTLDFRKFCKELHWFTSGPQNFIQLDWSIGWASNLIFLAQVWNLQISLIRLLMIFYKFNENFKENLKWWNWVFIELNKYFMKMKPEVSWFWACLF
jgi:hypothetical protein